MGQSQSKPTEDEKFMENLEEGAGKVSVTIWRKKYKFEGIFNMKQVLALQADLALTDVGKKNKDKKELDRQKKLAQAWRAECEKRDAIKKEKKAEKEKEKEKETYMQAVALVREMEEKAKKEKEKEEQAFMQTTALVRETEETASATQQQEPAGAEGGADAPEQERRPEGRVITRAIERERRGGAVTARIPERDTPPQTRRGRGRARARPKSQVYLYPIRELRKHDSYYNYKRSEWIDCPSSGSEIDIETD